MKPYYDDGTCVIYHGDALDILPTLGPGSVDLVVMDPPYFQPAVHYVPARGETPVRSLGDLSTLEHAFRSWADALAASLRADGTAYIFTDGQSYPLTFRAFYSLGRVRPLIWDKLTSFNGYTWRHQHELIAWVERYGAERVPTGEGDVLRHRAVKREHRMHPAEKPVPLLRQLIAKHSAATVLDCFAGSGATLAAARAEGRKAIGIEIEERYCEIAAKRLAQEVLAL